MEKTSNLEIASTRHWGVAMVQAKQPTVTLCQLMADFYAKRLFQQGETLISSTFPELQIQASAIFAAGQL